MCSAWEYFWRITFKWRAHHLKVNGEEPITRRKVAGHLSAQAAIPADYWSNHSPFCSLQQARRPSTSIIVRMSCIMIQFLPAEDILALSEAMDRLQEASPRQSR